MKVKMSVEKMKQKIIKKIENKDKKYLYGSIAVVFLLAVAGCHLYNQKKAMSILPVVNANVAEVVEKNIGNQKDYVALVEAINSVDVVAKVSGSLDKINFTEGSLVKKDDALFIIDKEPYQANYDLAKAQLESAEANLTRAERDYERQKKLSSKNIASKATFDAAESAYLQAKANVSQAKAQLELARINLDNTEVKAYIDGRIGKTQVTVGNFVNASTSVLARVVQVNPIRIAFSVTDKEFLEMQKDTEKDDIGDLTVNILLPNGDVLREKMNHFFVNNEINSGTATVAIYADINNEKHYLKPGSYVSIHITSDKPKMGLVVPETAIVQAEGTSYVYALNEDNSAKMKPVKLGDVFDGMQVITSGLNAGDKVLVSGLTNRMLRDGTIINVLNADNLQKAK